MLNPFRHRVHEWYTGWVYKNGRKVPLNLCVRCGRTEAPDA